MAALASQVGETYVTRCRVRAGLARIEAQTPSPHFWLPSLISGPLLQPTPKLPSWSGWETKAVDAVPGSSRGKSPVFPFWGRWGFILSQEAAAPCYLILLALAPDLVTGVLRFHEGKVTVCGGT